MAGTIQPSGSVTALLRDPNDLEGATVEHGRVPESGPGGTA
jgi:hypothetical protein